MKNEKSLMCGIIAKMVRSFHFQQHLSFRDKTNRPTHARFELLRGSLEFVNGRLWRKATMGDMGEGRIPLSRSRTSVTARRDIEIPADAGQPHPFTSLSQWF